jgi:hypothetical protein
MPKTKGFAEDRQSYDATAPLRSVSDTPLKIDAAGRIVIPAEMRAAMMLGADGGVTACVEDGVLKITSPLAAVRHLQKRARALVKPGTLVSDELIGERRRDATKE